MDPPGQSGWHSGRGSGLGIFQGDAVGPAGIGRQARRRSITWPVLLRRRALHRAEARLQGHHRSRDGARPRHRRAHDGSGGCDHDRLPQARLLLCADPGCRAQAAHLPRLRPGPYLLRRLCATRAPAVAACSGAALPGEPSWPDQTCGASASVPGARQNKVTHHGSPPHRSNAVLAIDPAVAAEHQSLLHSRPPPCGQRWCCLRCGRRCSDHVRQGSRGAGPPEPTKRTRP